MTSTPTPTAAEQPDQSRPSAVGGPGLLAVDGTNLELPRTPATDGADGAGPALIGLLGRGGGGGARHHASWGLGPHASRRRDLDPRGSGGPNDHCTGCAVTASFHGLIVGHRIGRSTRISPPGQQPDTHPCLINLSSTAAADKFIKALVSG